MKLTLEMLNVPNAVQKFFTGSFFNNENGELTFSYGDTNEYFGTNGHQIPVSGNFWRAGNKNDNLIRQVIICSSAMEAIAFLSLKWMTFLKTDQLLFLATGLVPNEAQFQYIRSKFRKKKFFLVMGNDILGKVSDVKIAVGMKDQHIRVTLMPEEMISILFKDKTFILSQATFTLNAFEKLSGLRTGIRTFKPKGYKTFLAQLLSV